MTACLTVGCSQGAGPHDSHDDLLLSGGWDGHGSTASDHHTAVAARGIDALARLDDLRAQVRAAYLDALADARRAATDPTASGRIRGVAHQTHASRLLRILDTQPTT